MSAIPPERQPLSNKERVKIPRQHMPEQDGRAAADRTSRRSTWA